MNINTERARRLSFALNHLKRVEEKEECEKSLSKFVQSGWRHIDPNPYVHGWHMDAICEHLEAVTYGHIRRLIINVPPRTSKSSIVSVAWPAWTWARSQDPEYVHSGPQVQFLFASYAQSLSIRDSGKTRRLIQSNWYQEKWGDKFKLVGDQNTKIKFENSSGGYRMATSVTGSLTGEGGSIIAIDDPHNAVDVESDTVRTGVLDWYAGSVSTRLNDPENGAIVLIMQRLHHMDLTGYLLREESKTHWTHLYLPMRYESNRTCITTIGWDEEEDKPITWQDPRTVDGELLCPLRFPRAQVRFIEDDLGPARASGQLQQRPTPRGGGIFQADWWQDWDDDEAHRCGIEPGKYPSFDFMLASLDTAYTEKEENDYSALTVWGIWVDYSGKSRIMLCAAWQDRLALHDLVTKVANSCSKWRVDKLLIESKASGISVDQEIRRLYVKSEWVSSFHKWEKAKCSLCGVLYKDFKDKRAPDKCRAGTAWNNWSVELVNPGRQDKVARAISIQGMISSGLVYLPHSKGEPTPTTWAVMLREQAENFPRDVHDDLVDTMVQALRYLRDNNIAIHRREADYALEVDLTHKGNNVIPLYPG